MSTNNKWNPFGGPPFLFEEAWKAAQKFSHTFHTDESDTSVRDLPVFDAVMAKAVN